MPLCVLKRASSLYATTSPYQCYANICGGYAEVTLNFRQNNVSKKTRSFPHRFVVPCEGFFPLSFCRSLVRLLSISNIMSQGLHPPSMAAFGAYRALAGCVRWNAGISNVESFTVGRDVLLCALQVWVIHTECSRFEERISLLSERCVCDLTFGCTLPLNLLHS